jgi:hypothetical protein
MELVSEAVGSLSHFRASDISDVVVFATLLGIFKHANIGIIIIIFVT